MKYDSEKANNTKYSKTKLLWFSRLLRYSARKGDGLILQCSRAHMGQGWCHANLYKCKQSPSVLLYCWLGLLTCKNRLPYNLYCVGGDVKHCTIQSNLIQYKYKLITLEFCGRRELQNMIHIVNSYLTVASKGSTLRATAGCRGDKNQL